MRCLRLYRSDVLTFNPTIEDIFNKVSSPAPHQECVMDHHIVNCIRTPLKIINGNQSFQNKLATAGVAPATSHFIAGYFFLMRGIKSSAIW